MLFNSVDVIPSLLSLCGVPVPAGVQGMDLSHAAIGGSGPQPDSVYLQNLGTGWPNRPQWVGFWRGVRTRRYVYARWKDRDGFRWLIDRQADPLEMENLANDPAHAELLAEMEGLLQRWMRRTADPFDTGACLPDTGMLDLGQQLTSARMYEQLPAGYRAAIVKYRPATF